MEADKTPGSKGERRDELLDHGNAPGKVSQSTVADNATGPVNSTEFISATGLEAARRLSLQAPPVAQMIPKEQNAPVLPVEDESATRPHHLLLFTSAMAPARAEIHRNGGRVIAQLTDRVFVAETNDCDSLTMSSMEEPEDLDLVSQTVVSAWQKAAQKAKAHAVPIGWGGPGILPPGKLA